MVDYLPEEVFTEVLGKLPIKSIVQCAFVCKSWYSLITNPIFITSHLNLTKSTNINNRSHLLLLRHYPENQNEEQYSLRCISNTFDNYSELECPFKSFYWYFAVVGCCNGVLCLYHFIAPYTKRIVLWNPSIRKSFTLPEPGITYKSHGGQMSTFGFGYDSSTNDYKVVRIVYLHSNFGGPPEVELYTLSTCIWRSIAARGTQSKISLGGSHVFMNGAAHWFASNGAEAAGAGNLIVSFDMADEVFKELMLPDILAYGSLTGDMSFAAPGEFLSVIHHTHYQCCIWVMKEFGVVESWVKQFNIVLDGGLTKAFGFRENGEVIMATSEGDLVLYNPTTKEITNSGIRGTPNSFYLSTSIESLVLLNKESGVLERQADSCDLVLGAQANSGDAVQHKRANKIWKSKSQIRHP